MGHAAGSGVADADLDAERCHHNPLDQLLNVRLHGGREHKLADLFATFDFTEQGVDLLGEAELKHLVGLVEHQVLQLLNLFRELLGQLSKLKRRPDQDLDAGLQSRHFRISLREEGLPHELDSGATAQAAGLLQEHQELFVKLDCQLSCRGDHDALEARTALQLLQERREECQRLATACLGQENGIALLHNDRDSLHLNRSWARITTGLDRLHEA